MSENYVGCIPWQFFITTVNCITTLERILQLKILGHLDCGNRGKVTGKDHESIDQKLRGRGSSVYHYS